MGSHHYCSSNLGKVMARGFVFLVAVVCVLVTAPGALAAPAGFGDGSGFCSSAYPGGYLLGASFDNVYACGPANNSGTGYDVPASGSYQGFFEDASWGCQCVELANRFVYDVYGLQPISGGSLDGTYYAPTLASERGVPLVANGTPNQAIPAWGHRFVHGLWSSCRRARCGGSGVPYEAGDGGNYTVTLLEENASSSGQTTATVTNWWMGDPTGSAVSLENFDALANSGSESLANGSFVQVSGSPEIFEIAGGAPLYVSNWAAVGGSQPVTTISQAQSNALPGVPANGTFIRDASSGTIGVVAGGSPLYVSNCQYLTNC